MLGYRYSSETPSGRGGGGGRSGGGGGGGESKGRVPYRDGREGEKSERSKQWQWLKGEVEAEGKPRRKVKVNTLNSKKANKNLHRFFPRNTTKLPFHIAK